MRRASCVLAATMLLGALPAAAPVNADVATTLPSERLVTFSPKQRALRVQAARLAVMQIPDFSLKDRAEFLDEAFRAASAKHIKNVNGVRQAVVVGERAYVVATVTRSVAPLAYQEGAAYFQCFFDESHHVVKVEVL